MNSVTAEEVASLEKMTIGQLANKYEQVIGEQCRSRHKRYLIRRIAWRLQANSEGGISERALKRAEELAIDAEIRVTPPRRQSELESAATIPIVAARDPRLPPSGTFIEREYKGRPLRVLVLENGFEYEGRRYKTLTAIANEITGSHVNGFQFFRLWSKK
ncbi:MAG TPA: DUF2924 domain-containing protein [Pirellulaceae bacterium]|nr:DUF2924 domain-containing protein [Pirellulaceae bacterium]HMO94445.1 DUF2924 domain-containing protein [Pirellulaceae bacterium]